MALPRLNEQPIYEVTIPSTGDVKRFRPFLVKEQRNMLIALESKDPRQMMNGLLNCITSCVEGIDQNTLTTSDADYVFTMIRSKSAGESTKVETNCKNCGHRNEVKINLDEVEVKKSGLSDVIKLTDSISLKMKYPTYNDIIQNGILNDENNMVENTFTTIVSCIHSVMTEEENILLKDQPKKEIEDFINSLSTEQFAKVQEFVDEMPTMELNTSFVCEQCNEKSDVQLRGMQDFFS